MSVISEVGDLPLFLHHSTLPCRMVNIDLVAYLDPGEVIPVQSFRSGVGERLFLLFVFLELTSVTVKEMGNTYYKPRNIIVKILKR